MDDGTEPIIMANADSELDIDDLDDFGGNGALPLDWPLEILPDQFSQTLDAEVSDITKMLEMGDLPVDHDADFHKVSEFNESDDASNGPAQDWPYNLPTRAALDKMEEAMLPENLEPRESCPTFKGFPTVEVDRRGHHKWAWGQNTIQDAIFINQETITNDQEDVDINQEANFINQGNVPGLLPRLVAISNPNQDAAAANQGASPDSAPRWVVVKQADVLESQKELHMVGLVYRDVNHVQRTPHLHLPEQERRQLRLTGTFYRDCVGVTRDTIQSNAEHSALGPQPIPSTPIHSHTSKEILFREVPDDASVNPQKLVRKGPFDHTCYPAPDSPGRAPAVAPRIQIEPYSELFVEPYPGFERQFPFEPYFRTSFFEPYRDPSLLVPKNPSRSRQTASKEPGAPKIPVSLKQVLLPKQSLHTKRAVPLKHATAPRKIVLGSPLPDSNHSSPISILNSRTGTAASKRAGEEASVAQGKEGAEKAAEAEKKRVRRNIMDRERVARNVAEKAAAQELSKGLPHPSPSHSSVASLPKPSRRIAHSKKTDEGELADQQQDVDPEAAAEAQRIEAKRLRRNELDRARTKRNRLARNAAESARRAVKLKSRAVCQKWAELTQHGGQ